MFVVLKQKASLPLSVRLTSSLCPFLSVTALTGIHHVAAAASRQAPADLSMTPLPLPLPTVSLNCTLIKLGPLIMRA